MILARINEVGHHGTASRSLVDGAFSAPPVERDNALLEVTHFAFPPDVEAGDFIRVDFTKTNIECDGLYVITLGGAKPDWIGIRRFQIIPGALRIYENLPGTQLRELTGSELADIQVIGLIRDVYKRN